MEHKLKLSKDIYPADIISCCIEQYRSVCCIDVSDVDNYRVCSFSNCRYDPAETIGEFENYLIGCSNLQVHHNDDP